MLTFTYARESCQHSSTTRHAMSQAQARGTRPVLPDEVQLGD